MLLHTFYGLLASITPGEKNKGNNGKLKNPEAAMPVPELIAYNGYPVEEHFVKTDDGFLLGLHRIPYGRNELPYDRPTKKPVMFLQHGLLCSSADWILNNQKGSLGFLLADAGFDVWMGNSRGNDFSKQHQKYSFESDEFWSFTWQDMAKYDLPASFKHIEQVTGEESLYYVGHSQGTMIAFAGFSENQEIAKKVKKFFALAPVSFLGNIKSPLKYLSSLTPHLPWLFDMFGARSFMPQTWLTTWLASNMCILPYADEICANIVFILCGYDRPEINNARLDVYMTHAPAGTSVKNIVHYSQAYESKVFRKYDEGSADANLKAYNQTTPPEYNLTNFRVPTHIFYGGNDWLATMEDVHNLLTHLPTGAVQHKTFMEEWMHLDFIWGKSAPQKVYHKIIREAKEQEAELKRQKKKRRDGRKHSIENDRKRRRYQKRKNRLTKKRAAS